MLFQLIKERMAIYSFFFFHITFKQNMLKDSGLKIPWSWGLSIGIITWITLVVYIFFVHVYEIKNSWFPYLILSSSFLHINTQSRNNIKRTRSIVFLNWAPDINLQKGLVIFFCFTTFSYQFRGLLTNWILQNFNQFFQQKSLLCEICGRSVVDCWKTI